MKVSQTKLEKDGKTTCTVEMTFGSGRMRRIVEGGLRVSFGPAPVGEFRFPGGDRAMLQGSEKAVLMCVFGGEPSAGVVEQLVDAAEVLEDAWTPLVEEWDALHCEPRTEHLKEVKELWEKVKELDHAACYLTKEQDALRREQDAHGQCHKVLDTLYWEDDRPRLEKRSEDLRMALRKTMDAVVSLSDRLDVLEMGWWGRLKARIRRGR